MKRLLVLTALIASLVTLVPAEADAARVPLPPSLTEHADTPCPYEGGSCSSADSDHIYVAPGAGAAVRYHEIGHQFDRQVLTAQDRKWFMRLFNQGATWDGPVEETFANAYAACAVEPFRMTSRNGVRIYESTLEFGYMPTLKQHRAACNAIAVIALVRGRVA